MPDDRCEIELLKQSLNSFKEDFDAHCKAEECYANEIKKNLHDVSESLQQIINKQNSQAGYIAGVASTVTLIGGIIAWFFTK